MGKGSREADDGDRGPGVVDWLDRQDRVKERPTGPGWRGGGGQGEGGGGKVR